MKRFLKWAAIFVGSLILLLVLVVGIFIGWLRWSGNRDWQRAEAELRAKGEKLTFAELVTPMPSDSENFFADPLWIELFTSERSKEQWKINQWKKPLTEQEMERLKSLLPEKTIIPESRAGALMRLKKILQETSDPKLSLQAAYLTIDIAQPATSVLTKISELSSRSAASPPINYQEGFGASLPHVSPSLGLGQVLGSTSLAKLSIGDAQHAADDIAEILALQKSLIDEPLVITFLVRQSLILVAVDSINNGIHLHQWNESALSLFQKQLGEIHLRKDLFFCLRGERACATALLENVRNHASKDHPSLTESPLLVRIFSTSFFLIQLSNYCCIIQNTLENLERPEGKPWNIGVPIFPEIEILKKSNRLQQACNILSIIALPALKAASIKTAECQTQVDQTLIACALERYRLANGAYPTSLDTLAPEYLTKLPNSPITGKPMSYSLNSDGTCLLWSPGWDLKSLGGKPGEFTGEGDIVWGQPLPKIPREKSKASE
jgi:hypothetical protein